MSLKYKITNGDKVLGNYHAHDAEAAVDKAIAANAKFGNLDFSKPFDVKRGLFATTIKREG